MDRKVAVDLDLENKKPKESLAKDSLLLKRWERLEKKLDEVKSSVRSLEGRLNDLSNKQRTVMATNLNLRSELTSSMSGYKELDLNSKALQKFKEHNLKKSASLGRKDVKVHGRTLLEHVSKYVKSLEAKLNWWSIMNE